MSRSLVVTRREESRFFAAMCKICAILNNYSARAPIFRSKAGQGNRRRELTSCVVRRPVLETLPIFQFHTQLCKLAYEYDKMRSTNLYDDYIAKSYKMYKSTHLVRGNACVVRRFDVLRS